MDVIGLPRTNASSRRLRRLRHFFSGLAALGLMFSIGLHGAFADDLTGRWIMAGHTNNGGPFAYQFAFGADGSFASEMDIGDVPYQQVSTAGVTRCVGAYRFDGRNVETRVNTCQRCIATGCGPAGPIPFPNGPVAFRGPNVMMLGDLMLQRQ